MSSSNRGPRHRAADSTTSGYVRTLDVYPIDPAVAKSATPPPPSNSPSTGRSSLAFAAQGTVPLTSSKSRHKAIPPAPTAGVQTQTLASSPSPAAATQATRTVSEEDYRLSPQEIQRRVQENLAAQVRSLLEARLQQRQQQARLAEAEKAAQLRRPLGPFATSSAEAAAESVGVAGHNNGAIAGASTTWQPSSGNEGKAEWFQAASTPTCSSEESGQHTPPPPFTTARLPTRAAPPAAEATPAPDPMKYGTTIDAYPYSAIELVRVHRLKGIANHNRGLWAGLAKRAFTTRSGHLVVNPDLEGAARVRSAVSGRVWEEHQQQQEHQQQPQQQRSSHQDTTSVNASSSIASASRVSSSLRAGPPRLVMKVVMSEGNQASFMWTEEDSAHEGNVKSINAAASFLSVATPLSVAVSDVIDHKYGKPLSSQEKTEADRRLRERRQQQRDAEARQSDRSATGSTKSVHSHKASNASRMGSGSEKASKPFGTSVHSTANSANGEEVAAAVHAELLKRNSPPASSADSLLFTHDLQRTTQDKVGTAEATQKEVAKYPNYAAGSTGGDAPTPDTDLPRLLTPLTDAEGSVKDHPFNSSGKVVKGLLRPPTSRAGVSVSDLDRTMSVGEAGERQRDRHARAEQSAQQNSTSILVPQLEGKNGHDVAPPSLLADAPSERKMKGENQLTSSSSSTSDKHTGAPSTSPPFHHRGTAAVDMLGDLGLLKHSSTSAATTAGYNSSGTGGAKEGQGVASGHEHDATDALGRTPTTGSHQKISIRNDSEKKQIETFLEHFPEAETHVQLRREAKNILDELEDLWDEDGPMSERPFPLPQFVTQDFLFPVDDGGGMDDNQGRQRQHAKDQLGHPADGAGSPPPEVEEEPLVGFDIDIEALQLKFRTEAVEDCADLAATRDALLAEVVAQRQLIRDFGDDIHFLSVGNVLSDLSAEHYAIELTRDVNAYARKNHLRFIQLVDDDEALREQQATEAEGAITLSFLERFGKDRAPTRDVGCQVNDVDLCYVDAAVRSTEAQLESLFHHEKALLNAVRLATVAVANILSFHASLEMESTCHECFFVFDKPRTLWPCGHTFCHACLATMYNARGDLICAQCGSVSEVGYTPNTPVELIANYQTVYTRADEETRPAANSALAEERDAQTIEGVLRSLLNDLVSTQHSWQPAAPKV